MMPKVAAGASDKSDKNAEASVGVKSEPSRNAVTASCPGKLTGKTAGSDPGFDIFDSSNTIDMLFGSLSGAALLESILAWFVESEMDIAWYSQPEEGATAQVRNVINSPLSRDLQEATVARYMERIVDEGLSQIVAGTSEGYANTQCK